MGIQGCSILHILNRCYMDRSRIPSCYVSATMKSIIIVVILLFTSHALAETLVTPSYKIEFGGCGEGVVSCDEIDVVVTNRSSNAVSSYTGKTMHSLCNDGVTPCQFQGYQFPGNEGHFVIHADGTLEISGKSNQAILVEEGKWSY
jgi:hypothetical protein